MPEFTASGWEALQAKAHLPEVQAIIRREIARGEIRVVPAPGGGIRIIPIYDDSPVEEPVPAAPAVDEEPEPELEEFRKAPVLRVRKRAR
jgi:hypothetical protein